MAGIGQLAGRMLGGSHGAGSELAGSAGMMGRFDEGGGRGGEGEGGGYESSYVGIYPVQALKAGAYTRSLQSST
jgi:hypothetical protein